MAARGSMTLEDFTRITAQVIEEDGLAAYLPTLALPETQHLQAIEGIPDEVPQAEALQEVILRSGLETEEFFFGVRSGTGQITTGHHRPGEATRFMRIEETAQGYLLEETDDCDWWQVGRPVFP